MTTRTQDIAQDLLRLSAQKLWAERANPVSMPTGTWIGCFRTEDRLTWRSTDGVWQAQLERSGNGGHVSLAFFCREVYVGRFDQRLAHATSRNSHASTPATGSVAAAAARQLTDVHLR
jgi:hypothetical protein